MPYSCWWEASETTARGSVPTSARHGVSEVRSRHSKVVVPPLTGAVGTSRLQGKGAAGYFT